MEYQVVILAAGEGKRMNSGEMPKVLHPLAGKPIIRYVLDAVAQIPELGKPILVVGYKSETVKTTLGEEYTYAFQKQQQGTADAVWAAKPEVKAKNCIVLYGDVPFVKAQSIRKLMQLHSSHKTPVSMLTIQVPNFNGIHEAFADIGRVIRDNAGNIMQIKEYADASEKEREILELNPAIYAFQSEWLWQHIPELSSANKLGQLYLTDLVEKAITEGSAIASASIEPTEGLGLNTPEDLSFAESLLK